MKILKKTSKYYHVKLLPEELSHLEEALAKKKKEQELEEKQRIYAEWFYTNHIDVSYQDEYSSWHTYWININTKKEVCQAQVPDICSGAIYKTKFLDIIKKNKIKLGYKD